MRLIDADALTADIQTTIEESGCVNHEGEILDCIAYADTVDAVPVVRCKDCVYYENPRRNVFKNCCRKDLLIPMNPNDYCSYGEKKEEAK